MISDRACQDTESRMRGFLRDPSSYPGETKSVEVIETHISWVFLAGRCAYKLKKPVQFDFLDFSTPELRLAACEAELRLNRRMSPSVYRAVIPITRDQAGRFSFRGEGEIIDWVVKMRRLDDRRTLRSLLTDRTRTESILDQGRVIATFLADFYANQPPLMIATEEFRKRIAHHVSDNEKRLLSSARSETESESIGRIHNSQKQFLAIDSNLLDDRVRDGRIVDGHGDLRPEHIYLYQRPLVIDCVEFSAEYRANDIVDELAFLAMECDRLQAPWMGRMLWATYRQRSNDRPPERLLWFYQSYRACVRAKVTAIRRRQTENGNQPGPGNGSDEPSYLELAADAASRLNQPMLILVGGLIGSGKSTLATQLARTLSAELVSSDQMRRQAAATDSQGRSAAAVHGFSQGLYSRKNRMANYRRVFVEADRLFRRNSIVILDATFNEVRTRVAAAEIAHNQGAQLLQIQCECPRDVALSRIAERQLQGDSASDATPSWYDPQSRIAEPPLAQFPTLVVDSTFALSRQESQVLEMVRQVLRQASSPASCDDASAVSRT